MIYSMTAFSKCEKKFFWGSVVWEIRSLNKRYLDIYIDAPKYVHALYSKIHDKIRKFIVRGRIECFLYIKVTDIASEFFINEKLLKFLIIAIKQIQTQIDDGKVDVLSILSWPGVMTCNKHNIPNIDEIILRLFDEVLEFLIRERKREGLFLQAKIMERLCLIREIVQRIQQDIPNMLRLKRKNLLSKMKDVCIVVDTVRLEQELLIVIQKIDISEEIDRMIGHVKAACDLLLMKEPMGRQLDFISQELYREANTISSKSVSFSITQLSISLKVCIEQIREQIQNIE